MQHIYFWELRFRPATDISTRFWKRNAFKVKLSHTSSCLPVKMFELCVQVCVCERERVRTYISHKLHSFLKKTPEHCSQIASSPTRHPWKGFGKPFRTQSETDWLTLSGGRVQGADNTSSLSLGAAHTLTLEEEMKLFSSWILSVTEWTTIRGWAE